ncbi:fibro-slime domain-containing protein [bacterium D16-76]|nr:fibro-slime domain-containing protein [bacterium D16-76]
MANAVFDKQAAKMLGKRRRNRRWLPVVACLAVVVVVGTFCFMIQEGQAMARKDMVLDCGVSVHSHTASCFDSEGVLACGYANYLVHEHNDDCYDKNGSLVCALPELKEHHHMEACYDKQLVAECGIEEDIGHIHTDSCYETSLACGLEESEGHIHEGSCYDEDGVLVCAIDEGEGHSHTDDCYEQVLTCGQEAGQGGHFHTDACKEYELVLTCQRPEIGLHGHGDACYDYLDENGESIPMEEALLLEKRIIEQMESGAEPEGTLPLRVLSCGMLQTEQHEHGNDCFKKVEKEPESEPVSSGLVSGESSELESSGLDSSMLESSALESSDVESSGLESSGIEESGLESSGLESSGLESEEEASSTPEEPEIDDSIIYEDESLKITAMPDAELPEGARLVAERLEEPNQLAQRQAKLKQTMEDEDYSLHALLRVALVDEDGEAVEFDEPIALTAEFRGEGASAQGGKVCAVAYREAPEDPDLETVPGMVLDRERAEVLPVQLGENGGAVTEIEESTLLGFGSKAPVRVDADNVGGVQDEFGAEEEGVLHIDQSFSYKADSMYNLVFRIQGDAVLPETAGSSDPQDEDKEPAVKWGGGSSETEEEDVVSGPVLAGMSDMDLVSAVSSLAPAGSALEEKEPAGEEGPASGVEKEDEDGVGSEVEPAEKEEKIGWGGVTVATGGVLPANTELALEETMEFVVERAQEGDPAYEPYADCAPEGSADDGLEPLEVLTYSLHYGRQELDISRCTVTVEIAPTREILDMAEELAAEAAESDVPEVAAEGGVFLAVYGAGDGLEEAEEEPDSYLLSGDAGTQDLEEAKEAAVQSTLPAHGDASVEMKAMQKISGDVGTMTADVSAGGSLALATSLQHNPKFTVDYYSYLDIVDRSQGGTLSVIDTSGRNLPQNSSTLPLTSLSLNEDGSVKNKKKTVPEPIYSGIECKFFEKPGLGYFDAMINSNGGKDNSSYELYQVWVLKENVKAEGMTQEALNNPNNWLKYGMDFPTAEYPDAVQVDYKIQSDGTIEAKDACEKYIHFTNKVVEEQPKDGHYYIYLKDGAKLRLIYKATTGSVKDYKTSFFDYDISDGKNSSGQYLTEKKGINSGTSADTEAKFAFGNANTGTGLELEKWNGNYINKRNREGTTDKVYLGCTFGMVNASQAGMDLAKGQMKFADGIAGPALFDKEAVVAGRVSYEGTLNFNRTGDTYTLTSANSGAGSAKDLDKFKHPQEYQIWTNNFWPMDEGKGQKDPLFGAGTKVPWKGKVGQEAREGTFPPSDDGLAHNSYFGMHYTVEFDLAKEYVGPLEYLFFGDDDMWVFLTPVSADGTADYANSQLVCDIGGVHSSVGEYVNLWDYVGRTLQDGVVQKGESDLKYQLDFFYTERGASGSTCWMQFTLPSVHGKYTGIMRDYGVLRIKKDVTSELRSGDLSAQPTDLAEGDDTEFIFTLKLTNLNSVFGGSLDHLFFRYVKYDKDNNVVEDDAYGTFVGSLVTNGSCFTLKAGESIVIENLPIGTTYEVTEQKQVVDKIKVTESEDGQGQKVEVIPKDPPNDYYASADRTRYKEPLVYGDPGGSHYEFGNGPNRVVKGEITQDDLGKNFVNDITNIQTVTYTNKVLAYELPKTGGEGNGRYIWVGAALCAAGLALIYTISRRRREVV